MSNVHISLRRCTRNKVSSWDYVRQTGAGAVSASFSCIFLRAANIISSLRRCNSFCLSSLLLDHRGLVGSSSFSLPFEVIFDCRLYLVIKSGSIFTGCCAPVEVEDAVNVIGG